jgi:hypothetical protein
MRQLQSLSRASLAKPRARRAQHRQTTMNNTRARRGVA